MRSSTSWIGAVFLAAIVMSRLHGLDSSAMQAMVIVEGEKGRGSGFVTRMDGKAYVVTNSHVIVGSSKVAFKTLANKELVIGTLQIADKVDLVRAEVADAGHTLPVAQRPEETLKIGDEIVVAGNAEGEGVVREIKGKVTGIGPSLIEVDAPFVPGNSGSPILDSKGQVLGVATYLKIPRIPPPAGESSGATGVRGQTVPPAGGSLNEIRRFGFRLDSVAKWVVPHPSDRILKEGLKLLDMEITETAIFLVLDARAAQLVNGSSAVINPVRARENPNLAALAAALDEFAARAKSGKSQDLDGAVVGLYESVKEATASDMRGFKEEHFSGYFATLFKQHLALRKRLYSALDAGIEREKRSRAAGFPNSDAVPGAGVVTPSNMIKLTYEYHSESPPERRHYLFYPWPSRPSDMHNYFWFYGVRGGPATRAPMLSNSINVKPSRTGTYIAGIVRQGADGKLKPASNTVVWEVKEAVPATKP